MLDRIGESTSRNHHVFKIEEILTFVEWDLKHNTLFPVWGIVLRQARKGVPIGGFPSAQLMCMQALLQENAFCKNPVKGVAPRFGPYHCTH